MARRQHQQKKANKPRKRATKATDWEASLQEAINLKREAREALIKYFQLLESMGNEEKAELGCFQALEEAVETAAGHRPTIVVANAPRFSPSVQSGSTKYISNVPESFDEPPTKLGNGWVLVHNHVRPHRTPAVRGFRAWWERKSKEVEPCPCGWYDDRGTHYRVAVRWRKMGIGTEE
jgi:hypothetical protein